jgi:diaminohydroxyphosphoribosylaminopyrimidine deaminase/5-amino-6-(5-phosphoribosylamino)uracil reductase
VKPRISKLLSKKSLVIRVGEAQGVWSNSVSSDDKRWMGAAISASWQAIGRTGVNPPVGCVLISQDGRLLAVGHTGRGGVPHAEVNALQSLCDVGRSALQGGTAYVTLEPCSHQGKTPPCSDALINAGIARLVVAVKDPDERVNGAGLSRVAAANIKIRLGVLQSEAEELLLGFINRLQNGKPYCSLKIASSIDGRVGLSDRKKRWVTGVPMRRYVHLLRSQNDAIVTGVGTVLSDDPRLDCRNEGITSDSPPVYVFDRLLRTPTTAKLFESQHKVTFFCGNSATKQRRDELTAAGASIVLLPDDAVGKPDVNAGMQYLGTQGVNHALIEAGPGLVTSILAAGAVDRIYWTQSNHILGSNALAAVDNLGSELANEMASLPEKKYFQSDHRLIGDDRLVVLTKSRLNS